MRGADIHGYILTGAVAWTICIYFFLSCTVFKITKVIKQKSMSLSKNSRVAGISSFC